MDSLQVRLYVMWCLMTYWANIEIVVNISSLFLFF